MTSVDWREFMRNQRADSTGLVMMHGDLPIACTPSVFSAIEMKFPSSSFPLQRSKESKSALDHFLCLVFFLSYQMNECEHGREGSRYPPQHSTTQIDSLREQCAKSLSRSRGRPFSHSLSLSRVRALSESLFLLPCSYVSSFPSSSSPFCGLCVSFC